MKTVKDISEITGVSIRTLRYYDEIGLLKPTELSEAGYRLYDDKALEKMQKIIDHTLECMSKNSLEEQIQKFGSVEKYREYLASGFSNEQAVADIFKWYGGKEKAMEAMMQANGNTEEVKQQQDEIAQIYKQFMTAKKANHAEMAHSVVAMLAEITDSQYGEGCSEYVANEIQQYYGISSL